MNQNTIDRAVAFIRTMANQCYTCFRRNEENCSRCFSRQASLLIREIELDRRNAPIDYSLYARMNFIREALKDGEKSSHDINTAKLCSKQLKRWTLRKMIRLGIISRRPLYEKNGHLYYIYSLTAHTRKPENTQGENHE